MLLQKVNHIEYATEKYTAEIDAKAYIENSASNARTMVIAMDALPSMAMHSLSLKVIRKFASMV